MSTSVPLIEGLASLQRRRGPALLTGMAIAIVAAAAAFLWPATYRSTGTILIEQQEVPVDLVRSMVSSYADQRIQMITQRVMTTENLMRIIDRYELYPKQRRKEPREVLMQRMRDDIHFAMISADVVDPRLGRPTKATIAFAVSFDSRSPMLAAKVANELTTLYLNENIESRKQLANDTASFLTAEGDRLNQQINELDRNLAGFKEKNSQRLPELAQLNMSLMTRTEDMLRETETRIRSLDQQIVYLDAQLAQLTPASQIFTSDGQRVMSPSDRLKVVKSDYARASAVYAPEHPDVQRLKREMEGLERDVGHVEGGNELARQLLDAQGKLAQARQQYSADHPDVQQLERLVASIESSMGQAPTGDAATNAAPVRPDNPAFIQVSAQREASMNERTSLQHQAAQLRQKIADFEDRLAQSPEIEREYTSLVRDLDNAQLKYREIRQKQMEATLAKNLESERKGERFTLIEPPLPPEEPASPNRTALLLLGVLLAAGGALGVVFLLEALDGSVRGRRDLEALLSVPPLAVLPWIDTPAERQVRKRRLQISMAGAATSVVVAVALVHFLYRPLDVIWEVALRRLLS
jgi:uncharacterized protein involved in exopolysaccharide biosynthesis